MPRGKKQVKKRVTKRPAGKKLPMEKSSAQQETLFSARPLLKKMAEEKKDALAYAPYAVYMLILLLFSAWIVGTPFLMMDNPQAGQISYALLSPTCHQLTVRSLCLVKSADGSLGVGNCLPQDKTVGETGYSRAVIVKQSDGTISYKFPVCSRCMAIYLAMLLGGVAFLFFYKPFSTDFPSKWILFAAAVPIAIDGLLQLLYLHESSNEIRVLTGALIGFVISFYLIPILNILFNAIREMVAKKE